MVREFIKPRPLLYTMFGIGIGLLLASLFELSKDESFVLGIILLVSGVLGEFLTGKK